MTLQEKRWYLAKMMMQKETRRIENQEEKQNVMVQNCKYAMQRSWRRTV